MPARTAAKYASRCLPLMLEKFNSGNPACNAMSWKSKRDTPIAALDTHLEKRYGNCKALAERFFQYGYGVPRGQLTHVLRHTFASHFMMNGGNILVLQKTLGHSTLTMRYAHLAPEHLQEAKTLNPLARLTVC